jgi:hypothetical protein
MAPMSRGNRIARYLASFTAGVAVAAGGYAVAAGGGDGSQRPDGTVSVRPTGVGLPLVGAHGTVGAGDYAPELRTYHDSGGYAKDLATVDGRAERYLGRRVKTLRKQARKRCRRHGTPAAQCKKPKLAMVLDIDETSLSNYEDIAATNFSGTTAALALSVVQADSPAIDPTLDLFNAAKRRGVAVFFITGRPDSIPGVRERTETNLTAAGYSGWQHLYLNPDTSQGTVPYKAGTRADIEGKQGYRIVVNVGDQESDLHGGHADRAFKLPNPFYFISD